MERDSSGVDGTMVAVLRLTPRARSPYAPGVGNGGRGRVQVANCNAPGQVALSGARAAVSERVRGWRLRQGLAALPAQCRRPVPLGYMEAAARDFRDVVEAAYIARAPLHRSSSTPALRQHGSATFCGKNCRAQITSPVLWEDSVNALAAMGCTRS